MLPKWACHSSQMLALSRYLLLPICEVLLLALLIVIATNESSFKDAIHPLGSFSFLFEKYYCNLFPSSLFFVTCVPSVTLHKPSLFRQPLSDCKKKIRQGSECQGNSKYYIDYYPKTVRQGTVAWGVHGKYLVTTKCIS